MTEAPLRRGKGQGDQYWVAGDRYTFKLTAAETGGAFSLFHFMVPHDSGSPPHTHAREDETFYILKGSVRITAGATTVVAGPGDTVFGPRGVRHSFHNVGADDAEMLCLAVPAGIEGFFIAAGQRAPDPTTTPPRPTEGDKARMAEAAAKFGISLAGAGPAGEAR